MQRDEDPQSKVLQRGAADQVAPGSFGAVRKSAGPAPDRAVREPSRERKRHPPEESRAERK